ncbi:thioesterase family protein [Aestuariibacter sp. A3R04]|uniref:acyl-CoA thioesterase n=1 Tax=Aestuariibacter sp. A3R04 TaxID=2841571 RepID=UPI001C09001A|nr:thioesterase family protein [Aestuariibacter sp. A3R04]MBU3023315.1 acyl-CoA thioesterase [Aestuariibacter sp. A3R04]
MSDCLLPPIKWRRPNPFVDLWCIARQEIDHYRHVNNVAYLSRVESLAWKHSNHLGLHFADYQQAGKGMVIRRHELDYLLPAHLGDTLACATWITGCHKSLTLTREFQFVCIQRLKTVFSAHTQFVCVSLESGTPTRMPATFKEIYGKAVCCP